MPGLYEAFGTLSLMNSMKYERATSIKNKSQCKRTDCRFIKRKGGDWSNLYHEYGLVILIVHF